MGRNCVYLFYVLCYSSLGKIGLGLEWEIDRVDFTNSTPFLSFNQMEEVSPIPETRSTNTESL